MVNLLRSDEEMLRSGYATAIGRRESCSSSGVIVWPTGIRHIVSVERHANRSSQPQIADLMSPPGAIIVASASRK